MPLSTLLRHALAATLIVAAVPAQAMPVREFLARWEKLSALREMANLDPDAKVLADELSSILHAFRSDVEAAAAAGKPIACLPGKGQAQFKSEPLLVYLSALPPADQAGEMKPATYRFLLKEYACKPV